MFIIARKFVKNLKYHRKLQKTFREARAWNAEHGVHTIADLNFIIKNNGLHSLISDIESWHQEQIIKIVKEIEKNKIGIFQGMTVEDREFLKKKGIL